jgi:predicted RNase H-like nuclease (RuvC/YqgF family)
VLIERLASGPIIGIDINGRRFSYAVFNNGDIIERGTVDPQDLIRIVKRIRPSAIAVDNIGEVMELSPGIIKRLGRLPFNVYLVQVTRVSPDTEESMEVLVNKYFGLSIGKLDPDTTAEYLARLCSMGVGSIVKVYEPETRIVIKASISTTPGGMSRNRFERNIAHRIRYLAKEIKERLEKGGIDYDMFIAPESEGLRSVVFIAYADRTTIRSIIKPRRSMDVKVIVESVPSDSIKFASLTETEAVEVGGAIKDRKLIVGIDPGIVTGLAILDMNGNVLTLHSGKNLSRRHVLRIVYQYGTPILVAVDTAKPSDYAKKLAAMIGAVLYYPDKDLSISEKSEIAVKVSREQGIVVKDPHMRDALAAAYKSFMQLKPKLDRVEDEVRRSIARVIDEAKALVIKGMPIKQAVDEASRKIEVQPQQEVKVVQQERCECECDRIRSEYEGMIRALNAEVERLNKLYMETKEKVEELLSNYDLEARKDQLVRALSARVEILEGDVEKYRRKVMELEDSLRRFVEDFVDYIRGSKYVLIRFNEDLDINIIAQMRNAIPLMTLGELTRVGIDKLISAGVSSIVLIDVNDKNILRPIWKRGLRVIPLGIVYNGVVNEVVFIDGSVINSAMESLGKELLSAVDEDYLRRMINEYRRLRSI